jgi:putative endonuclease
MPQDHEYYVYILASRSRTLYIGVTNNLLRRVHEHRDGTANSFTASTKSTASFTSNASNTSTIAREKYLKHFTRQEKIALIETNNPAWEDLAADPSPLSLTQTL